MRQRAGQGRYDGAGTHDGDEPRALQDRKRDDERDSWRSIPANPGAFVE